MVGSVYGTPLKGKKPFSVLGFFCELLTCFQELVLRFGVLTR